MEKILQISFFAFTLLAGSRINAQSPIKPTQSGSINGPSSVNCNSPAVYTFEPGFQIFCSSASWTVVFPDGREESYSGESIEIVSGSTQGTIAVFAFASSKSCNIDNNISAGTTTAVGLVTPAPSTLSGPSFLCNAMTSSYTASAVSGAGSYTFSVPTGWRINNVLRNSFTTTSRTVSITAPSSGRGTGQVSVKANPAWYICGTSSGQRTRTVTYGRQIPVLTAETTALSTRSFGRFTYTGIGISNVRWEIPNGWSAPNGLNGSELLVVTGNTPGNFDVEVTAQSCGVTVGDVVNVTVTNGFGGGGFLEITQNNNQIDSGPANVIGLTKEITVYPNPVSDELQLTMPNEGIKLASISIINISNGEQVLYQKMNNDSSFDLSKIEDGVYILNMITSSGEQIQKRIRVAH